MGTYHNLTLDRDRSPRFQRRQPFYLSLKVGVDPVDRKKVGYTNFNLEKLPLQGAWEKYRNPRDEFFLSFDYQARPS